MAKKAIPKRLPWEDCWREPVLEELLEPLSDQHSKPFRTLLDKVRAFEGVKESIADHGVSWHWTIVFTLPAVAKRKDGMHQFAYMVPNPNGPLICIPMTTDMISALPMRRLNRYIRDGVRVAKCAVDIHWCQWTPSALTEVEYLTDLLKRKHRMLTEKPAAPAPPAPPPAPAPQPPKAAPQAGKPKAKSAAAKAPAPRKKAPAKKAAAARPKR